MGMYAQVRTERQAREDGTATVVASPVRKKKKNDPKPSSSSSSEHQQSASLMGPSPVVKGGEEPEGGYSCLKP